MTDITSAMAKTKIACKTLGMTPEKKINAVLKSVASALIRSQKEIIAANAMDLRRLDESSDPLFDRLALSPARLSEIATCLRQVAALPSPLGRTLDERTLQNGLHLKKVSAPLGVIGIIYEARPNVTVDAFALCFKSGNACVLKGGSDAQHSHRALVKVIHRALKNSGMDTNVLLLLPPDRRSASAMMTAHGMIDVLIPRGGRKLIDYVRRNARIPVIETGAGIVHTYVDVSADLKKAAKIILNAKTRRPCVCNALDTLLIHRSLASKLPELVAPLLRSRVLIFADPTSFAVLRKTYDPTLLQRAQLRHFGVEFLSLKMAVRTVKNLDDALAHIERHGSRHSEALVARNNKIIERFLNEVDAAVVYANASTAFTDGAQFGMGSEIGISTQNLHARGPMALSELTSYKWIARGRGQVRP